MPDPATNSLQGANGRLADLMTRLRSGLPGGHLGLAVLLLVLILGFSSFVPDFLSAGTLQSFMYQLPLLGLLSLAMVVPLITGGLNLAIIATANAAGLLMAWILTAVMPPDAAGATLAFWMIGACLAGLLLCLAVGAVNVLMTTAISSMSDGTR